MRRSRSTPVAETDDACVEPSEHKSFDGIAGKRLTYRRSDAAAF